jgi:peptide/nickel transport system substrate-binding protein
MLNGNNLWLTMYSFLVAARADGSLTADAAAIVPTVSNGGISPNGKVITYHLRADVRWQDGTPLTAADVAYSYRTIMRHDLNVPYLAGYDLVRDVSTPDTHTVKVVLTRPYSEILYYFFGPSGSGAILEKHDIEAGLRNNIFQTATPVVSGPYAPKEWVHSDHLELTANPYFSPEPLVNRLDFRFVTSDNTMLTMLRTHELDSALDLSPTFSTSLQTLSGYRVVRSPTLRTGILAFNTQDPQLSDSRVRRAIALSIDTAAITQRLTHGIYEYTDPQHTMFQEQYDATAWRSTRFDRVRAAHLLDAAGWKLSEGGLRVRDGQPLELRLIFPNSVLSQAIAVNLQAQLQMQGILADLKSFSPSIFFADAASGGPLMSRTFEMAYYTMQTNFDPDVTWLFGCGQIPPHGQNEMRYCSPTADAAMRSVTSTFSEVQRRAGYKELQATLADDMPVDFLWRVRSLDVYTDRVSGVRELPQFTRVQDWRLTTGSPR